MPFIAAAVHAPGDRRRRQGLSGGFGLHDDLLRAPAGPICGQGPACGRLGLLVRRGRDDGDSSAPHIARPACLTFRRHPSARSASLPRCSQTRTTQGGSPCSWARSSSSGAMLIARRWPRSPAALLGVGVAVAAGYAARLARASARRDRHENAAVRRLHLETDRHHRHHAACARAGFCRIGKYPDHFARRRAFPGAPPTICTQPTPMKSSSPMESPTSFRACSGHR